MVTWLRVLVRGGVDCQFWRLLAEFPVLRGRLVALFALGYLDFAFALVSVCLCSGEWVLPVEYSVWIFRKPCGTWFNSGYVFYGRLWTNFSIFHVVVNSNPEAFVLHSV